MPTWGTLIGLNYKEKPVVGMMCQPYTGERFWGTGDQAYFRDAITKQRISTRSCSTLSEAVLASTAPEAFHDREKERFKALSHCVRLTRFGGDCYFYCMLAMGFIDLVVECGLKPFDIAPLIPIIEGAGGIVTTWDGGNPAKGGQIVAAGDLAIHAKAVEVLTGRSSSIA
jgi:myo-inositol-1(or 4)-monophosphatase